MGYVNTIKRIGNTKLDKEFCFNLEPFFNTVDHERITLVFAQLEHDDESFILTLQNMDDSITEERIFTDEALYMLESTIEEVWEMLTWD